MSCATQFANSNLKKTFNTNFSSEISPILDIWFLVTNDKTLVKFVFAVRPKTKEKKKRKVGKNLSVCVLKQLPKVSTLPCLVTINLVK